MRRELPLSPANGCRRCGQDFGSVSAFDKHFDWVDGVPVCLEPEELKAFMHRDKFGRWRQNGDGHNPFSTGIPREPELWSARRAAA